MFIIQAMFGLSLMFKAYRGRFLLGKSDIYFIARLKPDKNEGSWYPNIWVGSCSCTQRASPEKLSGDKYCSLFCFSVSDESN